jgi:Protein of unknown function (DUF4038)/Domain of unknown function (DUF5060)/Putative collagen-binding domain of a collagenase
VKNVRTKTGITTQDRLASEQPRPTSPRHQRLKRLVSSSALLLSLTALFLFTSCRNVGPSNVSFSQSSLEISAYDVVEVTADVSWPHARNPFTDAELTGWFESADERKRWQLEGFCDSQDGSIFRIRFMPPAAGDYKYFVKYQQGWASKTSTGTFRATDDRRRGPIRVDPRYPWHFLWEGTGEHYFFNGTTAYWLMGWRDDNIIQASIERLHRLKINRMRVTIAGRTNLLYGEPVMTGDNWTVFITPWPATQAEDAYHPGFDYGRFDVSYWQKFDRAVRYARDKDMIVSLVLDMNDGRVHPKAYSADERRFIRYAVDRFGSFSNITWDLGDDLDHYRSRLWTHYAGTLIKELDPYRHLATSHPLSFLDEDRTYDWFDFTSFQEWSRNQHSFMLGQRKQQEELGRIIPQTNEEYGYEDHYPLWSPGPPAESADALRRTAWDIAMAGGYQTTGESARRGTNVWPDTGGGWMNGRGDDTMTMLQGYGHMLDFFTSFEWWKTNPHDELVNAGNYCLAKPGEIYAAYLPKGGAVTIHLLPGNYEAAWFNPMTGEWLSLPPIAGTSWTSPTAPSANDWALLLRRK